jgi:pimeloyl-ACP methyl ester carboxylesterase
LSEAGLQVVNSSAIAGSGHYTPQERPDRFWSTVEDWLTSQRLFPRTTP